MVIKVVLNCGRQRWTVNLPSSVSPGHPVMGRFKGGHELRVGTILSGRQGVEVVVVVEGDNVVRPLDGGLVRCPLFRRGSVTDDRRNIELFLARVYGISFSRSAQPKVSLRH